MLNLEIAVAASFLLCTACQSTGEVTPRVTPLDEGPVYASPERLRQSCEEAMAEVRAGQAELTTASSAGLEAEAWLLGYNRLLGSLENTAGSMGLIANVHPLEVVRTAAETCERAVRKLGSEVDLDPALHLRLSEIEESGLDPEARRFRDKVLERLRLAGVDRSPEVKVRLARLLDMMTEVGQLFAKNIRDDVRRIEVDASALEGLPADFIAAHPPNQAGKVVLTTNYPDFFPVETYGAQPALRESLMRAFSSRGYPSNVEVLRKLLALRHEYASLLGHRSWADLQAQDKMVGSAARIRSFTEEVAELARPRMMRDLEAVLAEKQKREPGALRVEKWDRFYYVKEVQKAAHQFDPAEAREYLSYEQVVAGAFDLFSELFELEFVRIERPVWHPSVQSYELRLRGEPVGRFFLDMFPREGKYGHAAMFPITVGRRGAELSEAALVCNFPDPSSGPALMEHSQVVTFFHELGHLVHHLLARASIYVNQSGISTEWDFVEAPSQLLEEWAFDPAVLSRFARHHQTGAPMPATLIERMRAARDFGLGIHVMRQLFYQALSLELHDGDPSALDLDLVTRALEERYAPYPPMPETHEYAGFGHLEGYSSMYYTYQWSLALAKDLLTGFSAKGLLSAEVARAYRDQVLVSGGTKPAARLVADFLRRETNLEAYRAWLSDEN